MKSYSHRDRILAALSCQRADYIPCNFMIFTGLREQCANEFEAVERELEMGLDARVDISDVIVCYHPDVSVKQWKESVPGEEAPHLHKEYHTPAGPLHMVVEQSEDWPYGDNVPLLDDYVTPRSKTYLVTGPSDLPALRYLFVDPGPEVIEEFRLRASRAKGFAEE